MNDEGIPASGSSAPAGIGSVKPPESLVRMVSGGRLSAQLGRVERDLQIARRHATGLLQHADDLGRHGAPGKGRGDCLEAGLDLFQPEIDLADGGDAEGLERFGERAALLTEKVDRQGEDAGD